jgi:adhesin/invasin
VIEDPSGNKSDPVEITTDGVAPVGPAVDPSDGGSVTGRVDPADQDDAAAGDLIAVVKDPATGEELCVAKVQADGTFRCDFVPELEDGRTVVVVVVDPAGNVSEEQTVVVDSTPPVVPRPDPSGGETLTGTGDEPGDTITVKDEDGITLCETLVGPDRTWQCTFAPQLDEGDMVEIFERDPAGNEVKKPWRIGVPRLTVAKQSLCHNDEQAVAGVNFQPGEHVTAVSSGEAAVGVQRADGDGQVVFRWRIPEGTARNVHVVTLRGPASGSYEAKYTVVCQAAPPDIKPAQRLPFTGADGLVGMLGGALGLLAAGFFLLLAARRRRRPEGGAAQAG